MELKKLLKTFRHFFPDTTAKVVASAPGRVNLLGEHTDYNDGFVLPMAIDARIVLLASPNKTDQVNLYSVNFAAKDTFSLKHPLPATKNTWTNYIRGVCALLIEEGHSLSGMNLILRGKVPIGAGLSSSAALEVSAALLLDKLNGLDLDPIELIKIAQRAENEFVGVKCGIMDQFVSMLAQENRALFLDCRSLDFTQVPACFGEKGYALAVIDSGLSRGLVDSKYNQRKAECEQGVQLLQAKLPGIKALRDLTVEDLDLVRALPSPLGKRALHVITENQRVLDGVQALRTGDLETFGQLLSAAHTSLRDNYQVSCDQLDLLVELSEAIPGTLGACLTGAGFGGSIAALTAQNSLAKLKEKVSGEYERRVGIKPAVFVFKPAQGAWVRELS